MSADENVAVIRELADAYATKDISTIDRLLHDDVVFHVPGAHPLSGTYRGKTQVFKYLAQVAATSQSDDGGFDVHAVMGDAEHAVALVTGTIEHNGIRFVRPVVHVFHVQAGQVTEFWEASLDQHAEDTFWLTALNPNADTELPIGPRPSVVSWLMTRRTNGAVEASAELSSTRSSILSGSVCCWLFRRSRSGQLASCAARGVHNCRSAVAGADRGCRWHARFDGR